MRSYQKHLHIFEIRGKYFICLSTLCYSSTQSSLHTCCIVAWTGSYLGQIWSDKRVQSIYWIGWKYLTFSGKLCDPSAEASVHAHYIFACMGPNLSQIESDQKNQGFYGILRLFDTSLNWLQVLKNSQRPKKKQKVL